MTIKIVIPVLSEAAGIYINLDELSLKGEEVMHMRLKHEDIKKIYEDHASDAHLYIRRDLIYACFEAISQEYFKRMEAKYRE